MDEPRFAAGFSEGTLHGSMIRAGHFDRDDVIADVMLFTRVTELCGGELQLSFLMLDLGWPDEDLSVEVTEHPLGSCLGTIDRDDAKAFRTDFPNTVLDNTAWLSECGLRDRTILARLACGHSNDSIVGGK